MQAMQAAFEGEGVSDDAGIEDAFDVVVELEDSVKTATWVGACFVFTNQGMCACTHVT